MYFGVYLGFGGVLYFVWGTYDRNSISLEIFNLDFQNSMLVHLPLYPSVSALAGGNSDHGPRKTRTKTQTTPDSVFTGGGGERRNSDHGLSFWGGKTQTMV